MNFSGFVNCSWFSWESSSLNTLIKYYLKNSLSFMSIFYFLKVFRINSNWSIVKFSKKSEGNSNLSCLFLKSRIFGFFLWWIHIFFQKKRRLLFQIFYMTEDAMKSSCFEQDLKHILEKFLTSQHHFQTQKSCLNLCLLFYYI